MHIFSSFPCSWCYGHPSAAALDREVAGFILGQWLKEMAAVPLLTACYQHLEPISERHMMFRLLVLLPHFKGLHSHLG